MKAFKANVAANGKPIFNVRDGDKFYEVWGDDVRIIRVVHGCKQYIRMGHPRYAALRARILAACAA